VRGALLSPAALEEFRRRVVKRIADQNRQKAPDAKRMAELEAQVGNLADAIMSGALKASPALASRLAAAEAELSGLRARAVPREVVKLDRVIPRISPSHEIFFDKRHINQCRPINKLLI
jgi:hypothetical protein